LVVEVDLNMKFTSTSNIQIKLMQNSKKVKHLDFGWITKNGSK